MSIFGDYLPELLPDDPNKNAAARQGLLAFAGAMMNNRGGLLSGAGNGLVAAGSEYHNSLAQQQQQQQQQALRDAQIRQIGLETQTLQGKIDRPTRLAKIAAGIGSPGSISAGAPGTILPVSSLPQIGQPRAPVAPPAAPMGGANFNMGYGNDVPEAMPDMPQATSPAPQSPAQRNSMQPTGASPYQAQVLLAQAYDRAGEDEAAKNAWAVAKDLKPKYATDFRVAQGADGKLRNYLLADDGSDPKEVALGVRPEMVSTDTGGRIVWSDKNNIAPGQAFDKTVTPGEALSASEQRASRAQGERHWQQEQKDANEPGKPNMTMAKQIAFYKAAPLGQFSLNKPWGQATMDEVMKLNPQYDAAQYGPRAQALRSYGAGGKESLGIDSINTGMNHLDTLRQLALAQKNGNSKDFNRLANEWATRTGNAAPTNLRMATDMISPEIVKAVAGVAGTGEERAHMAESLTGRGSYSPDQILGAVGSTQELFAGRLREKKRSYERSTQLKNFEDDYLSPAAKALLQEKAATPTPASANKVRSVGELPKVAPSVGTVMKGFRFKGGDPANNASWEKVQ